MDEGLAIAPALQSAMGRARRIARVLALFAAAAAAVRVGAVPAPRPTVVVGELDGIIHPIAAEYLTGLIDQADTSNATLVVVVLRTPGGLLESTRTIVSRIITSRAPVVVFVAPSGARAASAGFVLTIAADVAAMAPGTHIGAAHPVTAGGERPDDTQAKKAASDTAAYVRSLAEARKRNVGLAEQAVLESRAFTDSEAVQASPPLVDIVAADLPDLLRRLDGRTITRFDGRSVTVDTRDADVRQVPMSRRQQFLGAIAHPQIAYLLLTLGILGLTVEIWNPGSVAPGVIGGLCLLLAFFAFQILPIHATGLLLILFGVGLLVLELKVPSFGALGTGGTIAIFVGSLMATRSVPGVEVGLGVILPAVLALAAGVLVLGRLALAAHRQPPVTGVEALIGQHARTLSAIVPGVPAHVAFHGELWQATSDEAIQAGASVRITEVNGLTLKVTPDGSSTLRGDTHGSTDSFADAAGDGDRRGVPDQLDSDPR
jgi:membrane-bound serine protease (ClpP class)